MRHQGEAVRAVAAPVAVLEEIAAVEGGIGGIVDQLAAGQPVLAEHTAEQLDRGEHAALRRVAHAEAVVVLAEKTVVDLRFEDIAENHADRKSTRLNSSH